MQITKIIITLFTCLLVFSCKNKVDKNEEILRPVKFIVVGNSEVENSRTFSGIAKASDEIELSFRSNGIITQLNIKVGSKVKKGDLIAKLDNVQANLAYQQAISTVTSAKSALNTSKSNLKRVKSLYEKGSSSLSDYESAKNAYQSYLDKFESAKRNKSIQQSQINYGHIYAPKSGVIASKMADLNENASAGKVIAILNAGEKTNIMVGLPENVINKVFVGMKTALEFPSIEDNNFEGSIIEIAPIIDSNSGSYPVKIDILNVTESIKPGMTANVTFNFKGKTTKVENLLVIPVKAVGEDGNGNYVYIIDSEDGIKGVVKKQTIVLGELTTNGFKVKSGLEKGQKIATAGLQTLLDGQKVKLQ